LGFQPVFTSADSRVSPYVSPMAFNKVSIRSADSLWNEPVLQRLRTTLRWQSSDWVFDERGELSERVQPFELSRTRAEGQAWKASRFERLLSALSILQTERMALMAMRLRSRPC